MSDPRKDGPIAIKFWSLQKQISDLTKEIDDMTKENGELKKQLEEKNNGFIASTEELVEYAEENQKLKKQLTKKDELIKDLSFAVDDLEKHYKTQQKEFIEWLENEINKCEYGEKKYADSDDMSYHNENELRKEILAKYKEIIRGRNGN